MWPSFLCSNRTEMRGEIVSCFLTRLRKKESCVSYQESGASIACGERHKGDTFSLFYSFHSVFLNENLIILLKNIKKK